LHKKEDMKTLLPYFTIQGRTEEALAFYKDCFKGEVLFLQRFSETPFKVSEDFKNKIAHAEFKAENVHFFVSDGFDSETYTNGNIVGLSVSFDNPEEHLEIAEKLKIGGQEVFDPNEIDTGDRMRIINDNYGIQWHLYVKS